MRSSLDLIRLPYTFAQLRPLLPHHFVTEARGRGLWMHEQELEALHRVGVLAPLLRFQRDGRAIAAAAREGEDAWGLTHWQPTSRGDLTEAHREGRLHDPAGEGFVARRRLSREVGEVTYHSSVFLYSQHQLITLPLIRKVLPCVTYQQHRGALVGSLAADSARRHRWIEEAKRAREIAVAVTALDPIYYSQVVGRLSLPSIEDFSAFDQWRRQRPVGWALRWLGVSAGWVKDAAAGLLTVADRIDPLGDWLEVVAEGEPEKWNSLLGEARSAMDLRVAAEILLLYYDDLVRAGRARPLPEPPPRTASLFETRLKRRRPLDALLTDFGLSPHPQLVLVVEGPTEALLIPRVMSHFGIRTDRDFIAVETAEGVTANLAPLIAYAAAPLIDEKVDGRYLKLLRTPTQFLIVLDAEGPFATSERRERRRQTWVDRLMRTLPGEQKTAVVREQVDRLVRAATWKRSGDSFEFAHFTDLQLLAGIESIDRRTRQPPREMHLKQLADARAAHGSLEPILGPLSKVDLADALWPTLERKMERAVAAGTEGRIPVVRVIDQAISLAHRLPRRNLVIGLEPRRRPRRR